MHWFILDSFVDPAFLSVGKAGYGLCMKRKQIPQDWGRVGQLRAETLAQAAGVQMLAPLWNGSEAPGKLLNFPVPLSPRQYNRKKS